MRTDNIKGSFNGSDILREFEGIPNIELPGNIQAELHSQKLIVGQSGKVEGYIAADSVDIWGRVSGTVMGAEIAAAGPITFDGYGSLHATYNVNLGGKSFKGGFTGTYIVNDDCTGTVTLHLPILGLSSNGSFVIVNDGKETFFTGTDTGVAITGATKHL